MNEKIALVIALWREKYFSDQEVIAWADSQILNNNELPGMARSILFGQNLRHYLRQSILIL